MSNKLSIFDFFSYLIPGIIYLFSVLFITLFFNEKVMSLIVSPTPYNLTLGVIISYIFGRAGGDYMYKANFIYRLAYKKQIRAFANKKLESLKKLILDSSLPIKEEFISHEFLERYISHKSTVLFQAIEKQNVLIIFSRNISTALLLLSIVSIILYFLSEVFTKMYLSIAIISLLLSILFTTAIIFKYAKFRLRFIADSIKVLITENSSIKSNS